MTSGHYASNALDGALTYFEDDGGGSPPLLVYSGFMDPIESARGVELMASLAPEFRLIFADHRGHGRSDKPHDAAAYALPLRVADVVAVLDALAIERAHFLGLSWGARLGFALAEHAPARLRSLVLCGNQPYEWDLESPIAKAIEEGLNQAEKRGMPVLLEAFEAYASAPLPEPQRSWLLDNDPLALSAAFDSTRDEGRISENLARWQTPCLIIAGETDEMHDGARRAAAEIPAARFMSIPGAGHLAAVDRLHTLAPEILAFLRSHQ